MSVEAIGTVPAEQFFDFAENTLTYELSAAQPTEVAAGQRSEAAQDQAETPRVEAFAKTLAPAGVRRVNLLRGAANRAKVANANGGSKAFNASL